VSQPSPSKGSLVREEDRAWAGFWAVVESLPPGALDENGSPERWSARDILAHVGSWHAEAALMLEQLRMGTYGGWDEDRLHEINRDWWEAWGDQDVHAVLAHLHSSRARMLEELVRLPDELLDDTAVDWFRDSGAGHYEEHLPSLRELSARGNPRKSGEADLESGQ
jgi:hypothetical protein